MSTIFFYWDIRPEKDKEYMDFIFSDYLPSMSRMGISVTDGWLKVAGEGPQIMALGESDDYLTIHQALDSREFRAIETRLQNHVENYSKHLARRDIKSEGR
ncbi:MAG: hypothetical protein WCS37_02570 [Chloroflexota bacterium]|nr:hypothetical protein [Chloroflexota bacterium]